MGTHSAAKFQQAMKLSATENEPGILQPNIKSFELRKSYNTTITQTNNKHRRKPCKLLKFYAGLRMKLLQQNLQHFRSQKQLSDPKT